MTNYTSEYTGTQIDLRLNNARTPTSHSTSHKQGGSDALIMDELGLNDNTNANVTMYYHGLCPKLPNNINKFLNGQGGWSTSTVINVKEYGAVGNGIVDDITAIQTAVTAAAGKTLFFPEGTYCFSNSASVLANTTIIFNNCTFKAIAAYNLFTVSVAGVSFSGNATHNGNGLSAGFVYLTGTATKFLCDMNFTVQNILSTGAAGAFNSFQASGITIKGNISTADSILFNFNGASEISIEGVACTYTNDISFPPIFIYDNQASHRFYDVKLQNIKIDGGGVLSVSGGAVEGQSAANPAYHVTLDNIIVKNTVGGSDGLDIMWVYFCTINNLIFEAVNVGLVINSNATVVNNVVSASCRAPAVGIGDPVYTEDITDVEINNCLAFNCGTAGTGTDSAGLSVYAPSGKTTTHIRINNCQSFTWGNQQYGVSISAGCQYVDVVNCTLTGTSGAVSNSATAGMVVFKNNRGINPVGYLGSQPSVPASTVNYTNTFGVTCRVYVTGGTVTAIAIGGTATGLTAGQLIVEPGEIIKLTYSSAPTWKWFGM